MKKTNSNKGKVFEQLLETVHHEYQIKRLAYIEKTPNSWTFCDCKTYERFSNRGFSDMVAKTPNGKYLIRQKSAVDYSGNVGKLHFAFDAKEVKGVSIPLSRFTEHQVRKTLEVSKCGGVAGFMVYFTEQKRVFFIESQLVYELVTFALLKGAKKSIHISEFENEIEFKNNKIDWIKLKYFKENK